MRQIRNYGDERQLGRCVYCATGDTATRDHVPSKVLLDEPFPENLPVVPACETCNASFSSDEEYLACLIDVVLAGEVDSKKVPRPKVARLLVERPTLASRLFEAKTVKDSETQFLVEWNRVRTAIMKLARGHAAYELNEPQFREPTYYGVVPLTQLDQEQRTAFESVGGNLAVWPEVGSRAMTRLIEGQDLEPGGWIVVQPGRYRYIARVADEIIVRMVLSEYLACEVVWGL